MNFIETKSGRIFFESTFPKLVRNIEELTKSINGHKEYTYTVETIKGTDLESYLSLKFIQGSELVTNTLAYSKEDSDGYTNYFYTVIMRKEVAS